MKKNVEAKQNNNTPTKHKIIVWLPFGFTLILVLNLEKNFNTIAAYGDLIEIVPSSCFIGQKFGIVR